MGVAVDPNPKTFEALFCLRLDIINIFLFTLSSQKFLVGVQDSKTPVKKSLCSTFRGVVRLLHPKHLVFG